MNHLIRIGSNITRLRKAKNITSEELGLMCDMHKSDIINIEKGRRNATINTLVRISDALGVTLKDLI